MWCIGVVRSVGGVEEGDMQRTLRAESKVFQTSGWGPSHLPGPHSLIQEKQKEEKE